MFQFQWPWLLLLIFLPFILPFILPSVKVGTEQALVVPFFKRLTAWGALNEKVKKPIWQRLLAYLIWVFLVIAAANPQWLGPPAPVKPKGRDIMLAIDLSGSMKAEDMVYKNYRVSRIAVVKAVASQFVSERQGDRIGLIFFGSRAYLRTPLTFDLATVQTMLKGAMPGIAGEQTAIGDAIGLAIKRLQSVPENDRVLILLTDGQNNAGVVSPLRAAQLAKEFGIKIYTIGLDTTPMRSGIFGQPTYDAPDNQALKAIAKLTGGMFFRAANTQDLINVYKEINKLVPREDRVQTYRPITVLYPWFLGMALLLSMLMALASVDFFDRFMKRSHS